MSARRGYCVAPSDGQRTDCAAIPARLRHHNRRAFESPVKRTNTRPSIPMIAKGLAKRSGDGKRSKVPSNGSALSSPNGAGPNAVGGTLGKAEDPSCSPTTAPAPTLPSSLTHGSVTIADRRSDESSGTAHRMISQSLLGIRISWHSRKRTGTRCLPALRSPAKRTPTRVIRQVLPLARLQRRSGRRCRW